MSYLRYRRLKVLTGVDETERAWKHLERPSFEIGEKINLNVMESEPSLSNRVNLRHTRLLSFLNAAIEDSTSFYPRFSKRYHLGHGAGIDGLVPQMTKLVPIHGIIELRQIITETFPKT